MPKRSLIDQLDQAINALLAEPDATLPAADSELLPLLRIAAELRGLPRENFKARLKADLKRSTSMATTSRTHCCNSHLRIPKAGFQGCGESNRIL